MFSQDLAARLNQAANFSGCPSSSSLVHCVRVEGRADRDASWHRTDYKVKPGRRLWEDAEPLVFYTAAAYTTGFTFFGRRDQGFGIHVDSFLPRCFGGHSGWFFDLLFGCRAGWPRQASANTTVNTSVMASEALIGCDHSVVRRGRAGGFVPR